MSKVISPDNSKLILNGHLFKGYADVNDAIQVPDRNIRDMKRGADGEILLGSTGQRGENLTITLLPNSTSFLDYMLPQIEAENNGAIIQYNGAIYYRSIGVTVSLQEGYLTTIPSIITVGQGFAGNIKIGWGFNRIEWISGTNSVSDNPAEDTGVPAG